MKHISSGSRYKSIFGTVVALSVLITVFAMPTSLFAQQGDANLQVGTINPQTNSPNNNREMVAQDKEANAESIVAREEAATGRAFDPGFRADALRKLASRTLSESESMQSQSGAGLGILPRVLGASNSDLVYTPVTPCRIIDTRVAGGPIGANAQRNFLATGSNYSGQGGFAGSCGIPFGPATAVVVNLVAVNPPTFGDLRAFPFGAAAPLASVLNYIPGNTLASGITLTICNPSTSTCGFDFTVLSDGPGTVDLVADVQGYFRAVAHTYQVVTGSFPITLCGGNTCGIQRSVSCPAGAQVLGGGVQNENFSIVTVESHPCPATGGGCSSGPGWEAWVKNPEATSQTTTMNVFAICAVSP